MSEKSMSASTSNGQVGDITDAKCQHMVASSKVADLIVAGAFVKNMRGSVTMPNELKPCPFCGNIPSIGYLSPFYHIVGECSFCNDIRLRSMDEQKLRRKWNRRADNG